MTVTLSAPFTCYCQFPVLVNFLVCLKVTFCLQDCPVWLFYKSWRYIPETENGFQQWKLFPWFPSVFIYFWQEVFKSDRPSSPNFCPPTQHINQKRVKMGKKYFDHIVICLLKMDSRHQQSTPYKHLSPMDVDASLLAFGPSGLLDNLIWYLSQSKWYFHNNKWSINQLGQLLIS